MPFTNVIPGDTSAVCLGQIGRHHQLQPRGESPARRSGSDMSGRFRARHLAQALGLVLAFGGWAAAAGKVDVVHFRNGDRLTCEIKNLDRSVLTISTDPLGSASVHWAEIVDITSPRQF